MASSAKRRCRLLLEECTEICSSHPAPTTSRNIETSPRGGGWGDRDGGATSSHEVGTSSSRLCLRGWCGSCFSPSIRRTVWSRAAEWMRWGASGAKWRRKCVADACGRGRNSSTAASLLVFDAKRLRMLVRLGGRRFATSHENLMLAWKGNQMKTSILIAINHNTKLCTPSAGISLLQTPLFVAPTGPKLHLLQRRTSPSSALADVAAMMLDVPRVAKSLAVHGLSKVHLTMYWINLTADIGDVEQS